MRQSHFVTVDSVDRDANVYPSQGSYRVWLPRTYKRVVAARLLSIILPNSFYAFTASSGNTTIEVSVDGGPLVPATIPDGNYTADSMASALQDALGAAFPGLTFAVSVDQDTSLIASITTVQGAVLAVDPSSRLAYLLGFRASASGTVVSGTALVNVMPVTYVMMDVEELSGMDEGAVGGDAVGKGCFAKIPVAGAFEYVIRDPNVAPLLSDQPVPVATLQTLTVTFRQHDGTVLDFRGMDHSFVLEVVVDTPGRQGLEVPPYVPPRRPGRNAPKPVGVAVVREPQPAPARSTWPLWAGAAAVVGGTWWWARRGAA